MHNTVLKMGSGALYQKSQPIENLSDPIVGETVERILQTLEDTGTFIGLSAPQIGIPIRLVLFRIPKVAPNPRYHLTPEYDPEGVPQTILINPVIQPIGEKTTRGYETCLSLPGMMGIVERYHSIRYTWQSPEGEQSRIAHGFHARVVQHECDHLDGILYHMRIKNPTDLGFQEEIMSRGLE